MSVLLSVSALVVALGLLADASAALGQTRTIDGAIMDSSTRAPLSGVRVTAVDATNTVAASTTTDGRGRFRLSGLTLTSYTLLVRRVGYAVRKVTPVRPAESGSDLEIALDLLPFALDPIQVTSSRMAEAMLDAPASVSVIDRRQIEESMGFTPLDYIRTVPGMDFASKGLIQNTLAVRGLRPPTNGAMLVLTDDRRSALPSTGVNLSYLLPSTSEDIARIEVVRGPGAALYGPGAARGVLQIVTRSPFESPGAAFSLAGGERDVFEGTARLARVLSPKLAFKVSGAWFQGHDWEQFDSLEVRARRRAIAGGANPDTLRVGLRDFRLRRATAEARFDWRPDSVTTVTSSVGGVQAINVIDVTGDLAGVRFQDWRYGFAQAKLQRGGLFANVTYNLSDAGDTYLLQSGSPLVDDSRQATAQVQNRTGIGRVDVLYGLDGKWTNPRTGGTYHGRNENDDMVAEAGGYAQTRASVSRKLDFVVALRVDHNNRLNDLAVSPRVGAVLKPGPRHALRLTYNRAFTAPEARQLFLDIALPAWPFAVRQVAVPQNGYSFRRDCGGICMRSPFSPAGRDQYLPADATLVWDSVVAKLARAGHDISNIPRPSGSQVKTHLAELDGGNPLQSKFDPINEADIVDLPGRKRAIYETLEVGYKAVLDRLMLSVDLYSGRVKDAVGSFFTITPSVFYDPTTLAAYLNGFRAPAEAARLTALIDTIRVGTVSPQEALDPLEILRTRRQGGGYTLWGADASITAALSSHFEVVGTYSWMSRNLLFDVNPDDLSGRPTALSAPLHKGSATLRYRDDRSGLTAALEGRAIGGFPISGGDASVSSYAVLDASVAYQIPWTAGVGVSVKASNLLNHMHREIDAAPALGRLVVAKVQVRL